MKLGFIGLGIMGYPMSRNLLKGGHELLMYDVSSTALGKALCPGAAAASSPQEIGRQCDVIFVIVPDSGHVESVVSGEHGILSGARPGTVIVDMSSILPTMSRKLYDICRTKQVDFLDAPVSGGEPKAIDGTLAFMVGGNQAAYDRVKDILLCMGASSLLVGDSGSGTTAKLVNQIIVNLNIAAAAEGMAFAAKAGVDPQKVYQAIRGGLAGSAVLDAKVPMMLARDFQPGGSLQINYKDIRNVMGTATDIDMALPLTAQLQEMMKVLKTDDKMGCDHSGLVLYYEKINGVTVTPGE